MIKVTYECSETKQKMEATISAVSEHSVEMEINFSPEISDETADPYGIMGRIFSALTPGSAQDDADTDEEHF